MALVLSGAGAVVWNGHKSEFPFFTGLSRLRQPLSHRIVTSYNIAISGPSAAVSLSSPGCSPSAASYSLMQYFYSSCFVCGCAS
jgi:hypothetical protein